MLYVGASQSEITPPTGTPFGGFAVERTSPATAVHDPLLATATVLSNGDAAIAVVSCDLQTIAPEVVSAVRQRIVEQEGIPPQHVLIGATHVHSAPGGDASERQIPGVDRFFTTPEAQARIEVGIVQAVADAHRTRQPATLWSATGHIAGIGRSRHQPADPTVSPASLLVARALNDDRALVAAIVNYGCHPSVLGPDNTAISADYPMVVRRELSQRLHVPFVNFLNAPAGDISTRATRQAQTFAEVERLGRQLSDQLMELSERVVRLEPGPIGGARRNIDVPIDHSLHSRLAQLLAKESDPFSQRAHRLRLLIERLEAVAGSSVPCEVQVLRCGDVIIIGIAAELFSEPARLILDASPAAVTLIVAPANGTIGNVPPAALHESVRPLVDASAEGLLRRSVAGMVIEMFTKIEERTHAG